MQILRQPRHADIVLITGPLTTRVKDKVLRVWHEIPAPKVPSWQWASAPISGGVFRGGTASKAPWTATCPWMSMCRAARPGPRQSWKRVLEAVAIWREKLAAGR